MTADNQTTAENQNRQKHLLIIEDDPDMARALSIALRSEGYGVQTTGSSQGAQQYLRRAKVDLVIADWFLSDGTAAEACATAREVNPDVPIIVISGFHGQRAEAMTECNATVYLEKPLSFPELFDHVRVLAGPADI